MNVQSVTGSAAAGAGSATGSSASDSAGGMDVSFLNLLITEMKSQDPTAPMDATQMVGQMISLNQLDQLIAIHQLLQPTTTSTAAAATSPASQGGH